LCPIRMCPIQWVLVWTSVKRFAILVSVGLAPAGAEVCEGHEPV
jgi:hypothetical protein